jgi:integrase
VTGHVRFHKGSWNAVIFQGRRINSKGKLADSYRWITGFKTKREADEELTRQLSDKQEGSYVEPHKMTVTQYLRHWLKVVKTSLAPKTYQEYAGICERHLIPALGAFHLVKLTAIDAESFYAHALFKGRKNSKQGDGKKAGLSPRTVIHCHRVLHKAFEDAVRKKIVSHNVIHAAQAPRANDREMQAPDETTMANILAETRKDGRIWLPVAIVCGSGLRRGEALALRWRDVDLVSGAASITRSLCQTKEDGLIFKSVKKKKSRRVIVLPEFVLEALREALGEQQQHRKLYGSDYQNNDLICCQPDGRPMDPNRVSEIFAYLRRRLMLTTRFHDLRHGHASQALQNGIPVKTVQARLGHSTAAFTLDVYGHLLPGDDQRAADTIQRTLGAAIQKQSGKSVN